MSSKTPIIVIIATSGRRTNLLIQKAIPSVLEQSVLPQLCVVVDDNTDAEEGMKIEKGIMELKNKTMLPIIMILNTHTKGFSGTGAWNTGLEFAREYSNSHGWKDVYVAILDDDDSWQTNHIELCVQNSKKLPEAIFCNLTRIYKGYSAPGTLFDHNKLTIENFLYGNPGVQGSNMCFKLSSIEAIGGFDESLKSCTDRDLMIRFLERYGNKNIVIIKRQTVLHDSRSKDCVTNNIENKAEGLNKFYKKHINRFDEKTLSRSLERAKKLFSYKNSRKIWEYFYRAKEIIAVMMPLKNGENSIRQAVLSFVRQKPTKCPSVLFIGNDSSSDNWIGQIEDLLQRYPNIVIKDISGGSAPKARNALTEYIIKEFPKTYFICRLDSDDKLTTPNTLSYIEFLFESNKAEAVLGGNYQSYQNTIIGENRAKRIFHSKDYMSERLMRMSQGDVTAELPSCNLCFKPRAYIPYPMELSAEDHWMLINMLLTIKPEKFIIAEDLMYCTYNIGGSVTFENKKKDVYINSRKKLYEYYIRQTNL